MSLYEKAYFYVPESGTVALSDALRKYLTEQLEANQLLQEPVRKRIQQLVDDKAAEIGIPILLDVHRADKRLRREQPHVRLVHRFNSAVFSSGLTVPELRLRPTEPALIKRRERLQLEADKREYERMVSGIVPSSRRYDNAMSIGAEWRAVNNQLIAVVNCLLAALGGFAFGYVGLSFLGFAMSYQSRVLFGFSFFVLILFIEMYFFTKYVLGTQSS